MAFTLVKGLLLPDTSDTGPGGDSLTKNFIFIGDAIEAATVVEVVTLGGTPSVDSTGRWKKIAVANTDFTPSGPVTTIPLFILPAGSIIEGIKIKHSAAFVGGTVSAATLEVGITGTLSKYATAFDVFQAPGDTVQQHSFVFDGEDHANPATISATLRTTGGSSGDLTAGAAEIWAKISRAL